MKFVQKYCAVLVGFAIALGFLVWGVNADASEKIQTLVCEQYGHTDNPDDFHNIITMPKVTTFIVDGADVTFDNKRFVSVDPETVGLEGLAVTYILDKEEQLLYLYTNEQGEREVGVSHLEENSDSIFQDKSVYTSCKFRTDVKQYVVGNVLRVNLGGSNDHRPTYTF